MRDRATGTTASQPLRVVYFGTPAFAVPTLEALVNQAALEVCLVVTQPDRPAGRGRRLAASSVKIAAEAHGLPVYQPPSLRTPDLRAPIADLNADLFVVAAYGLIFGPKTLALPRIACVNVHASLLPAFRGASPISAAILQGDSITGVSLMVMDEGLDTGPVIATGAIPVDPRDTTDSLTHRLATLGAELVATNLARFASGEIVPVPQPTEAATVTRPLVKSDGWLDWNRRADDLERHVRAMWPWPRAWTTIGAEPLQVHQGSIVTTTEAKSPVDEPGTLVRLASGAAVACGDGFLVLDAVQRAGGRPISGEAFMLGHSYLEGMVLGAEGRPSSPVPPLIVPV